MNQQNQVPGVLIDAVAMQAAADAINAQHQQADLTSVYSPLELPVKLKIHMVQSCATAASKAVEEAGRQFQAWAWSCLWKHTSFLLFMILLHDEVWPPFIVSMMLVLMIVWYVYVPSNTSNLNGCTYIPKCH